MSVASSHLFKPFVLGDIGKLEHRVVMAPLTRLRNNKAGEPTELAVEYYSQRSSVPGTLIIAEGTFPSLEASGIPGSPGLWTEGQIKSWRKVTDKVHANGCIIIAQIYAAGSAADPADLSEKGVPFVNVSAFHWEPAHEKPRALSKAEIKDYVTRFGVAARNAVQGAGFDGVELHFGNGYLMDNFLQTISNTRSDEYGGSVENRIRFALESLEAMVQAVGPKRVGFRVSPWSRFQGMRMPDTDIIETFSTLFMHIRDAHPDLAFAHVIQPRISGGKDDEGADHWQSSDLPDAFLHSIWKPRPYIAAGGFTGESASKRADTTGDLIAFGRFFISNPDLPIRLQKQISLTFYDRSTFYGGAATGYTDFPFAASEDKHVSL
ncbi:NADH:flavin oxidoreductase/NADH oxidase [Vararia minispora EC-137]|uniref:NADH:flavin oxidoreductase/NADH oxidase n=1 Tax=Vararia minispora EC-137 TaxID=1314806 RepID=A0ACB8QSR9_9AGAM|nr:NADH:flavin oxidoreductase/NADH oxidase [Vararia minispora EC-137]